MKEKLLGTSATHTVPSMTDQTDQMHSYLTHTALTVFKLSVVLRLFLRQQFRNQNHNKNCRLNDPTSFKPSHIAFRLSDKVQSFVCLC